MFQEWQYGGTVGILALGLRIRGASTRRPSLLACVGRNLLTLVVPFILSGKILSNAALNSSFKLSCQWAIAIAILIFIPISMIFTGGQSLADVLFHTRVLPTRSSGSHVPVAVSGRVWTISAITAILAGAIYGFMPSMLNTQVFQKWQSPRNQLQVSSTEDKKTAAGLWPYLQLGIPSGDVYLRDVHVFSVFGPLPDEKENQVETSVCQTTYRAKHAYKLVRLQFDDTTPTLLQSYVFSNLFKERLRFTGRPAFLVVQTDVKEHYGIFSIEIVQNHTMCLSGSDAVPENVILGWSATMSSEASFTELSWLFLGDLEKFSMAEHLPIFP